ncbi:MAG: hypothetical protein HC923_08330 [Myxococcales bacterium]|nr:hypothetical protein [Myxococcales bacterium]
MTNLHEQHARACGGLDPKTGIVAARRGEHAVAARERAKRQSLDLLDPLVEDAKMLGVQRESVVPVDPP